MTKPSKQRNEGALLVPLAKELSATVKVLGHIYDSLQSGYLISIGQLCDDICAALFTKYQVKIIKNGQVIIVGRRNATNGLWNIPLAPKAPLPAQLAAPPHNLANGAIQDIRTKQDTASFLDAYAFSLDSSTFLRAIQCGHFASCLIGQA